MCQAGSPPPPQISTISTGSKVTTLAEATAQSWGREEGGGTCRLPVACHTIDMATFWEQRLSSFVWQNWGVATKRAELVISTRVPNCYALKSSPRSPIALPRLQPKQNDE